MSARTGIEWCDSTFNPWIGCTRISPGCDDCYAARSTPARTGGLKWGAGQPRRRTAVKNWKLPERWNSERWMECGDCGHRGHSAFANGFGRWLCGECGGANTAPTRRRVFCASLADWLDNEAPIDWLVDLLDLIRRTPNLDWLLLTKRIGSWRKQAVAALRRLHSPDASSAGVLPRLNFGLIFWLEDWIYNEKPPAHVRTGSTVVDEPEAIRDVRKLLAVPGRHFLSIEPMLGPIDWYAVSGAWSAVGYTPWLNRPILGDIDWVIVGGESGVHARPAHPNWIRQQRDQCAAAGVPFLFKQWGEWQSIEDMSIEAVARTPGTAPGVVVRGATPDRDMAVFRCGRKLAGRELDSRTHDDFPVPAP